MSNLDIGDVFPSFYLLDQAERHFSEKDLVGHVSVVYFYPKDDTSGCTIEANQFRESPLQTEGIQIFGVSPDSVKSHCKFADKFDLNFSLLADTDHSLCEACGVWVEKSMYGNKYWGVERSTFAVGKDGKIVKVWRKVVADGHAKEVLEFIRSTSM